VDYILSGENIHANLDETSRTFIKRRHIGAFRIALMLLIFGALLTMSAAANTAPTADNLTAVPSSPQSAGTAVTFTATATDPDPGDTIRYRFWVKGMGS